MPKSPKGKKIYRQFLREYGIKGKAIAYATANKQGGKLYRALHGRSKR